MCSSPDERDRDGQLLHNYWSKLLLIIRPISMAAAATEKAAAAAAAQKALDEARYKAAAEASGVGEVCWALRLQGVRATEGSKV